MEVTIKNSSSRMILEEPDVILYDVGEDNNVSSRVVYELYYKDGILDFDNMATMLVEIMELLKIPMAEEETNRALVLGVTKIDPNKPSLEDEEEK